MSVSLINQSCVYLLNRCTFVARVPPGLGGIKVAAPQLPVEALSRQWILFNLKRVIFDVVEGWGYYAGSVLLNSLQNRFSPTDTEEKKGFSLFVLGFTGSRCTCDCAREIIATRK